MHHCKFLLILQKDVIRLYPKLDIQRDGVLCLESPLEVVGDGEVQRLDAQLLSPKERRVSLR